MTDKIKTIGELKEWLEIERHQVESKFGTSNKIWNAYIAGLNIALEKIGELEENVREKNLTDDEMATLEGILYKRPDSIIILSKLRELRMLLEGKK